MRLNSSAVSNAYRTISATVIDEMAARTRMRTAVNQYVLINKSDLQSAGAFGHRITSMKIIQDAAIGMGASAVQ